MSNLSVNHNQNLNPLNQSGKKPLDQSQSEPENLTPRQSLTESARKQLFDSQRKLTDVQSGNPELDVQDLSQQLDQIEGPELMNRVQNVPQPQELDRVRVQIGRARSLPLVPQQRPQIQNLQVSDLNLNSETLQQARQDYEGALNDLTQGRTAQTLKNMLRDELKPFLKELSKSDKLLSRSKTEQENISNRMKTHLTQLLRNTGTQDDLSLLLDMFTKEERKHLLSELVGEIREDKTRTFEELSSKKQNFVNQALDGIIAGMRSPRNSPRPETGLMPDPINPDGPPIRKPPSPLALAQENLVSTLMTQLPEQLTVDQVSQLKLMSDGQISELFEPFTLGLDGQVDRFVIKAVRQFTLPTTPRQLEPFVKDLQPEDLGGEVLKQELLNLVANPGSVEARAGVRLCLREQLESLPQDHNTLWQLGVMSKKQLHDMLQELAGYQAPPEGQEPVLPLSPQDIKDLVLDIRAMLPNTASEDSVELEGKSVPRSLTLGDKTYEVFEFVAKAGFGSVYSYKNTQDPKDLVAVKILSPEMQGGDTEKLHSETVRELNLHRELQGPNGHPNVIGLKASIHGPDGSLCMVQEYAPGGDLFNLGGLLNEGVDRGDISQEGRRLLGLMMLKQSLESVAYLHDDRQMLHSDLKSSNLMIGQDGQVKMIDFGTAYLGVDRMIEDRFVDNPIYMAPEQMVSAKIPTYTNSKSDVWSMGTLAFELLVGPISEHPGYSSSFMTDIEEHLKTHARDVDSRLMSQMPQQNLDESTREIYNLIDSLMMPVPGQRLSAREALELPIFQDPRLESEELKQIAKQLLNPIQNLDPQTQLEPLFEERVQREVDKKLLELPENEREGVDRAPLREQVIQTSGEDLRKELPKYFKVAQIFEDLERLVQG
ncbi:MAG: hypothetical protein CVV27_02330 [Candidatus Melainabacteria bacterium HGW-Melainabacteria-1]|nr:MAG: hypothetical protein CVV27_02330 [Candidatus Melainabacteria bacterium HGW-Melainabacteria-1]